MTSILPSCAWTYRKTRLNQYVVSQHRRQRPVARSVWQTDILISDQCDHFDQWPHHLVFLWVGWSISASVEAHLQPVTLLLLLILSSPLVTGVDVQSPCTSFVRCFTSWVLHCGCCISDRRSCACVAHADRVAAHANTVALRNEWPELLLMPILLLFAVKGLKIPKFPNNIVAFPNRDFVHLDVRLKQVACLMSGRRMLIPRVECAAHAVVPACLTDHAAVPRCRDMR